MTGNTPPPSSFPPTVLVTVNPGTVLDWKIVREDVILIIEYYYLPGDVGTDLSGMHLDAL